MEELTKKELLTDLANKSDEFKHGYCNGRIDEEYLWKCKIKAKIEELDDKGMTVNLANRSAGKTFQQVVHYEVIKVLQSLLGKE